MTFAPSRPSTGTLDATYALPSGLVRLATPVVEALCGPGPGLVLANHPSPLDAVALFALQPRPDCIVNTARTRNPFLRGLTRAAGYFTNDRGSGGVAECVRVCGPVAAW